MSIKNLEIVYKSFLIKSLIQDKDKWAHKDSHGYNSYNIWSIDYPDMVLSIEVDSLFDKVSVTNKFNGEKFWFLSIFNFLFEKELNYAYKHMKRYHLDEENRKYEESFMNIIPLSTMRKEKLKKLLDL